MSKIKSALQGVGFVLKKAKPRNESDDTPVDTLQEKEVVLEMESENDKQEDVIGLTNSVDNFSNIKIEDVSTVLKNIPDSQVDQEILKLGFTIKAKHLGSGAFGEVKAGTRMSTKEEIAVKIITVKDDAKKEKHLTDLKNELTTMERVKGHVNVISLFGHIMINSKVYIFMEIADGRSVSDIVKKEGLLTESKAKRWFFQIALGVNFMHSKGIAHRDIKLNNILLKKTSQDRKHHRIPKLSDFGLSRVSLDFKKAVIMADNYCGTEPYMSPEIFEISVTRTRKLYDPMSADVWALGVTLYAMLTRAYPFSGINTPKPVILEAMKGSLYEYPKKVRKTLSSDVQDLIRQFLEPNPHKRITFQGIFSHPWLTNMEDVLRVEQEVSKKSISVEMNTATQETNQRTSRSRSSRSRSNRKA